MKLPTRIVEKPWGRTDIPAEFGDMGGRKIGEIWFEDPDGDAAALMVKFLFTSERLSVQVHPDDTAARASGYPRGKEECWLVLAAEEDAELGVGLLKDSDVSTLRDAALDGSIEQMIDWRPASVGDFVYNRAGTIHAMGAGVTVVEVQQNVDCTYRLYDYGRLDNGQVRALHLDDGLAVLSTTKHHEPRDCTVPQSGTVKLVDGPHFHLVRATGPIDPLADTAIWPSALFGPSTVTPLSAGCTIGDDPLHFGECARVDDLASVTLLPNSQALLCWPV